MPRFRCAIAAAIATLCVAAPVALAHQGNPNFRSAVRSISPAISGLDAQVVNYDDSIELRNNTGRTVLVNGYDGEPYVRIAGDGTVAVNHRSPSYYLNEDRFGEGVDVPASASAKASPDWQTVDGTGRYTWHDHRIHWMSHSLPPQVKDEHKRTKIFNWKVPIAVGASPATIGGRLVWVGKSSGGFPVAGVISIVVFALAGLALVVVVRKRRRRPAAAAPAKEAW